MKTVVQLFTGGITGPSEASLADVRDKLTYLLENDPPYAVVCGWSNEPALYEELHAFLRPYGTKMYCWYPAFAALQELDSFAPMIASSGKEVSMASIPPNSRFYFYCPSSEENLAKTLRIYDETFSSLPFDGVFLDRVRFPSFSMGIDGVLNCFCPSCMEEYKALGLDGEMLRASAEAARARIAAGVSNPLGLKEFTVNGWICEDPGLTALLDARCLIVARAVGMMKDHFAAQGLELALDLFTPSLGWFAGQGYRYLLPHTRFIKPMVYRHTQEPAGIPYEFDVYDDVLRDKSGSAHMLKLLNASRENDYATFVEEEMRHMVDARTAADCDALLFPGMETNCVMPTVPVTEQKTRDAVRLLKKAGADGLTASWSLAKTPWENLKAFVEELR